MSYRGIAYQKFPGRPIHGAGRWALVNEHSGEVYLFLTEADALRSAPYHNCAPKDLAAGLISDEALDRIPDRMDADERRRERRSRA